MISIINRNCKGLQPYAGEEKRALADTLGNESVTAIRQDRAPCSGTTPTVAYMLRRCFDSPQRSRRLRAFWPIHNLSPAILGPVRWIGSWSPSHRSPFSRPLGAWRF